MTMNKNIEFLQAEILLLILTVISIFTSANPYLSILFAGLLMMVFTMRSLSEQSGKLVFAVQLILSILFAVIAGGVIPFLIFYECRIGKRRLAQVFFSPTVYLVCEVLGGRKSLPQIICNMLILLVVSGVIRLAEHLIESYISAKKQISRAVSVTAVNEMYEKKLNRELTIKNYLADKNARLEERENISRNIHNSVGHSITAAIMTLDAAEMLFDTAPDKAREKMNTANNRIRTSLNEIRHAVRVLDQGNKFISMADFIEELQAVIRSFEMDTTIVVRTDFADLREDLNIPHEHTEFLTGAVQELLTNGVRHGNADVFGISLTADSGHIMLKILDNGKSDFSEENRQERIHNGFGLKKLISYVKQCGGSASFVNDNGFLAELVVPLIEEELNE